MKKLILTVFVCSLLCLAACSNQTEDTQSDVLSADAAVIQSKNAATTAILSNTDDTADIFTAAETEMTEESSDSSSGLYDDSQTRNFVAHLPETAKLGNINVNNVDIDISGVTLGDFLDVSGLELYPYSTTELYLADYDFVSSMYGIQSDENDLFSFDSLVSVEIIDCYGQVIQSSDNMTEDSHNYIVKGVCTSDFFTGDDFDVTFYGNIKCGMTIDDVYAALGGKEFADEIDFYAAECFYLVDGVHILVILPNHGIADKIMLLNV